LSGTSFISLSSVFIGMELLTFGGDILPCLFIFLLLLHWNLYTWGQVLGAGFNHL
jgi:hypothetical protein